MNIVEASCDNGKRSTMTLQDPLRTLHLHTASTKQGPASHHQQQQLMAWSFGTGPWHQADPPDSRVGRMHDQHWQCWCPRGLQSTSQCYQGDILESLYASPKIKSHTMFKAIGCRPSPSPRHVAVRQFACSNCVGSKSPNGSQQATPFRHSATHQSSMDGLNTTGSQVRPTSRTYVSLSPKALT